MQIHRPGNGEEAVALVEELQKDLDGPALKVRKGQVAEFERKERTEQGGLGRRVILWCSLTINSTLATLML